MEFNRDQFLEEGYVILRQVIPPQQLAELRQAYELLVERQKVIWAREREPHDPPRRRLGDQRPAPPQSGGAGWPHRCADCRRSRVLAAREHARRQ